MDRRVIVRKRVVQVLILQNLQIALHPQILHWVSLMQGTILMRDKIYLTAISGIMNQTKFSLLRRTYSRL
jgi:hypothetical protein